MPDYYPTSLYSSDGEEEWVPTGADSIPHALDEVGTNNGDTDFIRTICYPYGGPNTRPYWARAIIWLSATPLPAVDPTDLAGAILKVQVKKITNVAMPTFHLQISIGLGDPEEGIIIGQESFPIDDFNEGIYDEVGILVNDNILPLISPSSLRPYAIILTKHD